MKLKKLIVIGLISVFIPIVFFLLIVFIDHSYDIQINSSISFITLLEYFSNIYGILFGALGVIYTIYYSEIVRKINLASNIEIHFDKNIQENFSSRIQLTYTEKIENENIVLSKHDFELVNMGKNAVHSLNFWTIPINDIENTNYSEFVKKALNAGVILDGELVSDDKYKPGNIILENQVLKFTINLKYNHPVGNQVYYIFLPVTYINAINELEEKIFKLRFKIVENKMEFKDYEIIKKLFVEI